MAYLLSTCSSDHSVISFRATWGNSRVKQKSLVTLFLEGLEDEELPFRKMKKCCALCPLPLAPIVGWGVWVGGCAVLVGLVACWAAGLAGFWMHGSIFRCWNMCSVSCHSRCPNLVLWHEIIHLAGRLLPAPWGNTGRSKGTWEHEKGDLGIQSWNTKTGNFDWTLGHYLGALKRLWVFGTNV